MSEQPRPQPGHPAPGDPPSPAPEPPAPPSVPDAGRDGAASGAAPAPWDVPDTPPWDPADTVPPEPDDAPPVRGRSATGGETPPGQAPPGETPPGETPPGETPPGDAATDGPAADGPAADGSAADGSAGAAPDAATGEGAAGDPQPARRRRDPLAAALIGLLTLLLGFAIAIQVRTTGSAEELQVAREEDLVRILDELEDREDRLREQLAEQRSALRDLSGTDSRSAAALEEARDRAEALGILNGTVAAEGPGLVMTIRDPQGKVRVADLLDAIQELRGAGAETLQIDGVRIGVSSAVTGEPGDLRIDGEELDAPYEVLVIGSPQDLQTAMNIPGGVVDRVGRQGGSVDIVQSERVVVDALRPLDTPQYASPRTGDGD